MIAVYPNLAHSLAEYKISYHTLADILGINESEIVSKMQGIIPWSLADAVNICCLLNTSDVKFLFLRLDSKT